MQNKQLWIAVALTGVLMALVFVAGWLVGRPKQADAVADAAPVPVEARAVFIPGAGQIDALRRGVPVDQEGHPPPLAHDPIETT